MNEPTNLGTLQWLIKFSLDPRVLKSDLPIFVCQCEDLLVSRRGAETACEHRRLRIEVERVHIRRYPAIHIVVIAL